MKPSRLAPRDASFRASITRRYGIALGLIATILIASFLTVLDRMEQNEENGFVINTAGQQRMLSQRIALLVREAVSVSSPDVAQEYVVLLASAVERMESNLETLRGPQVRRDVQIGVREFYEGADGLGGRTERFLAEARSFLDLYSSSERGSSETKAAAESLAGIARTGFLDELDAVIQAYQRQFERDFDEFKRVEGLVLGVALLVLLLEVIFIFRPMAKTVSETLAAMEIANEELRQFSFRVSHDLRAPIASSLGMIEIAQESNGEGDAEETEFALGRIDNALARMDELIESVVSVTRSSMLIEEPEPVELRSLIEDVLERLAGLPGFERMTIQTDIRIERPLLTRRVHLRQVLENLISNAVKYADLSQETPTIDIMAQAAGRNLELSVSDNGCGIDPEYQDQVFGMFKRFHADLAFGSGLGLYLVKQSATALGGTIAYQPLEQGTKFTLKWRSEEILAHA